MKQRKNVKTSVDSEINEHPSSFDEDTSISHTKLSGSLKKVFITCLYLRVANALLVQTYFNPDEHWQALEVAHRVTFGYGHLTWEWEKGIRSYLHPMIFSILYNILSFFRLDTPCFMIKAPRVMQSIFSAIGDLYLYKLSNVLFGGSVAKWALFSQLTNWFMFFCINRTLSNSLETVLTVVGLYYFPWIRASTKGAPPVSRKFGLLIAALACSVRPTSAIQWIYIGLWELLSMRRTRDRLKFIFLEVAPIGYVMDGPPSTSFWVLVVAVTCLLDRVMYGSWVLVPLNFLKFNFLSSGGDYYGTHPWHWYFTQGFSVMVFTFIPFSAAGIILSKQWKLSGLIELVLGVYSLLGHKEFRFVLPVLPISLIFSGWSLALIEKADMSMGKKIRTPGIQVKQPVKLCMSVLFLLATNLPMALYMSLVHQRGTEDAMNYLSKEARDGQVQSILFLMPCHATPFYSTLYQNLPMRFLDCTPSEQKGVPDESERFMMNPLEFTSDFVKSWSRPSHIVVFDGQEKMLKDFLVSRSFHEEIRFFHAHFKVDRDLQAAVVVYGFKGQ